VRKDELSSASLPTFAQPAASHPLGLPLAPASLLTGAHPDPMPKMNHFAESFHSARASSSARSGDLPKRLHFTPESSSLESSSDSDLEERAHARIIGKCKGKKPLVDEARPQSARLVPRSSFMAVACAHPLRSIGLLKLVMLLCL
jgi:hypothetical protein